MFDNRIKYKREKYSVDIIEVLVDFTFCGIRIIDLGVFCVIGGIFWWGVGMIRFKIVVIKVMNKFKKVNL